MATPDTITRTPQAPEHFVFPDPPEDRPEDRDDKMTNHRHMSITGTAHALVVQLGNPETTVVRGEAYLSPEPAPRTMAGLLYPDLLVAFDADPEAFDRRNAYVISEQGKPPDFVLEVVSPSSGRRDRVDKPLDYALLGVGEYWWFDGEGRSARNRLAGHRLAGDSYELLPVRARPDGSLQGHSAVLGLHLRWTGGELVFCDPATGESIATLEAERSRAEAAEARAAAAEARVRELERRLSGSS
ncbi:MAG: Uma2 family endonuclease [Acidimicrobiaceae bacterium]|nr:Uma2 family endonuclease [Acidimicrobiaceae bacterium]MYE98406.1 Uma2 family endonuclease [Acidimicrobiaceae bacterium]